MSDYRERRLVADISRDSPPPYTPPPPPPLSAAENEVLILLFCFAVWPSLFFSHLLLTIKTLHSLWSYDLFENNPTPKDLYSPGEGRHWGWAWMSDLPRTLKTSNISGSIITNFAKKVKVEFEMDTLLFLLVSWRPHNLLSVQTKGKEKISISGYKMEWDL